MSRVKSLYSEAEEYIDEWGNDDTSSDLLLQCIDTLLSHLKQV